jgi:hypothetical protein
MLSHLHHLIGEKQKGYVYNEVLNKLAGFCVVMCGSNWRENISYRAMRPPVIKKETERNADSQESVE